MKRRALIAAAIAFGLLAVIVAGWMLTSSRSTPAYQGHSVNYWLAEVYTTNQATALGILRQAGPEAMPAVVRAFSRRDSGWYGFYQKIHPKLPAAWRRKLPRPAPAQQLWSAAEQVMYNNINARTAFPDLLRLLGDDDSPSRYYVLFVVAHNLIRPEDSNAVPVLVKCVLSPQRDLRGLSVLALQKIGPGAKSALPALTTAMSNNDLNIRVLAAWAIWGIDRQTNAVAATLKAAINTTPTNSPGETDMRWFAANYLSIVNPTEHATIPVFIEMLKSSDQQWQNLASHSLGQYGPAAASAVPALINCIELGDERTRDSAIYSLKQIDPAAKYEPK